MGPEAKLVLRTAGPVAGAAWMWLTYFDLKDSLRPEPRRLLLLAFALGAVAAGLAGAAYAIAPWVGLPAGPGGGTASIFLYCVAIVGPVEEAAKFGVAAAAIFRLRHFDEPIDGLIYASAISIGFASAENLVYAHYLTWWEHLARVVATPLIHSLFSAPWGFGAGRALLVARPGVERAAWMAGSLLLSMLAHGLYDASLLAFDARWLAGLVALGLWLFLVGRARGVVRRRGWAGDAGSLPGGAGRGIPSG